MAWVDDVKQALTNLGGYAHLFDIYKEIKNIKKDNLSSTWQATVRRTLEEHSSDTQTYQNGDLDLFYSVDGIGQGIWGIRNFSPPTAMVVNTRELKGKVMQLEKKVNNLERSMKILMVSIKQIINIKNSVIKLL